jgi:hypothetical protein
LNNKPKITMPRPHGAGGVKNAEAGWPRPLGRLLKLYTDALPKVVVPLVQILNLQEVLMLCAKTINTKNPNFLATASLPIARVAVQNGTKAQAARKKSDSVRHFSVVPFRYISKSLILEV